MCRQADWMGRSQCETFDRNTFQIKKQPFFADYITSKSKRTLWSIELFFTALLLLILSQTLLRGRFLQSGRLVQGERPSSMPPSELGLLRQQHTVSGVRYLVSTLYLQLECIYSFLLLRCMFPCLIMQVKVGFTFFPILLLILLMRACLFVVFVPHVRQFLLAVEGKTRWGIV